MIQKSRGDSNVPAARARGSFMFILCRVAKNEAIKIAFGKPKAQVCLLAFANKQTSKHCNANAEVARKPQQQKFLLHTTHPISYEFQTKTAQREAVCASGYAQSQKSCPSHA